MDFEKKCVHQFQNEITDANGGAPMEYEIKERNRIPQSAVIL